MTTLGDFTEPRLLVPHLLGADQASAIHELAHRLQQAGRIPDSLGFFQAVLHRDYLTSSVAENGVAFPHARGRDLPGLSFALGLSDGGVRWHNGASVRVIFLLAVPVADSRLYLNIMAELTRFTRSEHRLKTLLASAEPRDIWQLLKRQALPLPVTCAHKL
jgi:mannitol/fructose-specific phosphotransferase system IIA component (Ntr-type)